MNVRDYGTALAVVVVLLARQGQILHSVPVSDNSTVTTTGADVFEPDLVFLLPSSPRL